MKLSSVKDMALIAVVVAVLYYLWRNAQKVGDTIASPIADAITGVLLPGDVQLQGMVRLPNGQLVSFGALDMIQPSTLTFVFNGARYRIDHRDGSNYIAVTA